MKIILTCGPAYAPMDAMRRLTNASTGTLGITLANLLTAQGHEVVCLIGQGATCPIPLQARQVYTFGTNEECATVLRQLSREQTVGAVLHAAALCDFTIKEVRTARGRVVTAGKFSSRVEGYRLVLQAAPKVLPKLRRWFPQGFLAGWKYEVDGTASEALAKARAQIKSCRTNLCVLNGPAYGAGYGLVTPQGLTHADNASMLASLLGQHLPR